ncbi:lasso peptide biosynthesis B2 protein [Terriglobus sp. 2YAB30_2]|uniref:lasso peptide biosynthesis B2 protein n=1 Tax=unclassified Terriglobus TaxID=2628988 RepID=UPI003F9D941B
MPWNEQSMIAEAFLLLAATRAALLVVPFRAAAGWVGVVVPPNGPGRSPAQGLAAEQRRIAEEVAVVVRRASRVAIFESKCLPQALAARMMLKRRDVSSVIHFGVRCGEERKLLAHAWLEAGDVDVTGGAIATQYSEIARVI